MFRRAVLMSILILALASLAPSSLLQAQGRGGMASITAADLRQWLTTFASDEFEGRATYSEGLGLAASYLAQHLREWGVKPGGDGGSYFQRVAVKGVKATSRSSVTVTVNGQSRTFKDGEGITFPRNAGGKRTFTMDQVEFVGYGLNIPAIDHNDYRDRDVRGKVAIWIGARGPAGAEAAAYRRLLGGRGRYAIDDAHAAASIGQAGGGFGGFGGGGAATAGGPGGAPGGAPGAGPGGAASPGAPGVPAAGVSGAAAGPGAPASGPVGGGPGGFGAPGAGSVDFTTVQRLDSPVAPSLTAQDAFFEFLFGAADLKYADLKERAARQEPLPRLTLTGVSIAFNIDTDYQVVRTQFTRNVVGIIEGTDPKLRSTYVAFGAHYDHVGQAEPEVTDGPNGPRRTGTPGRVKDGAVADRVWNGADDDGSGSMAILAVARAFALGPKPKRSLVFIWHAGEERGLLGSRYYADYPGVSIEAIVAQLNLDMVGRNRDDKTTEANTVYLVGSDRISTELHNLSEDANRSLKSPLTIDYEMNDPTDLEQVYYRSDHYSYAAKGIPVIFYTTGLHPDYHANTDSVDKIEFAKMARIAQLVYETGRVVANLDHAPSRDNQGPRAGKGTRGKLQ